MGLLAAIVLGAFVGWIASIITNRSKQQGWVGNVLVGIVGSLLGSYLSAILTGSDRSSLSFNLSSLLWALFGAVVLCGVINLFQRGSVK